jgi:HK97 family phage major capsid protein
MPALKDKLTEVNDQISEKRTEAQEKWSAFEAARDKFASAGEDANNTESEAFKEMDAINKEYSASSEELANLEAVRDGVFRAMSGDEPPKAGDDGPSIAEGIARLSRHEAPLPLGAAAVEGDSYKELKASGLLESEHAKFNARLAQGSVQELKASLLTGGSETSAGAFVEPDHKGYVPQPQRTRTVLDLITTGTTDSDTVEWVRQNTFTNVAAEIAEATTLATGTKPEASLAFEKVSEAVSTIAHWIPSTRRALSDAGQLRTIVDGQLRYGLELRMENQVVAGNGTGDNLLGILNTPNILGQAKGSDSVADAVHKGMTQMRLGYIEPTGVALFPTDWEKVRLSRDDSGATAGTGGYLYGPPAAAGTEQLWGKPVAVTAAVTAGTGIVGAWYWATLWLREGVQILASDSHSDFFIKNLIAILAETRAAFGVQMPPAFCKVTGL